MHVRFSIRGLMIAVVIAAAVLCGWRSIDRLSSILVHASFLLSMWIGLFALLLWGAFRYDRESPEGRTRLIWLLGLATFAVLAFGMSLPAILAARRSR